ncbi:MAG TPA: MBL fold metallo-hydrolase [Methylomirabilota bacterium]|nr:MBL fold metallo-hydrolase [Methylomirabilota bacterium]
MKITKYVHACLLVETPGRTALFDPGTYSKQALDPDQLTRLDDIFITHVHQDHCDPELIKRLVAKFPAVRIIATDEAVKSLAAEGIKATTTPPAGVTFFDSPHESMAPLIPTPPQENGIHYLDSLSHPGDSHSFKETKAILALPVQAPWGSSAKAISLALELKPRFILPIHDWHWSDAARTQMYDRFEKLFGDNNIQFFKLQTGQPIEITL